MNRLAALRSTLSGSAELTVEFSVAGVGAICDPTGALYLPDMDLLVVSDLHLEKGAAFARRGQLLPPYDTLSTLRRLETVVTRYNPAIVVSLGDNFHDRVGSALMPPDFRSMIAAMVRGREWIWINGNHDPDGVVDLPGRCADELRFGNLVFRHEPSLIDGRGEIAGHLHPSATVRRREKSVRRACFASDGTRLLMPAFGVLTGGLDLRHRAFSGLFDHAALIAHLLGRDRVYSVRYTSLIG